MKRADFNVQGGATLIELVVAMSLMLILFYGITNLFSVSLKSALWNKNQCNLNQTARIAVDSITREIRYAQQITFNNSSSLMLTKVDGETKTLQLGGGLHSKTLYFITDRTRAVPHGGISSNPVTENIVTNLQFTPFSQKTNRKAVLIFVEVTDAGSGRKITLHTACCPLNRDNELQIDKRSDQ